MCETRASRRVSRCSSAVAELVLVRLAHVVVRIVDHMGCLMAGVLGLEMEMVVGCLCDCSIVCRRCRTFVDVVRMGWLVYAQNVVVVVGLVLAAGLALEVVIPESVSRVASTLFLGVRNSNPASGENTYICFARSPMNSTNNWRRVWSTPSWFW